ncbi:MAG: c-type cytochrome [Candidatus Acidiferrales bacterium]
MKTVPPGEPLKKKRSHLKSLFVVFLLATSLLSAQTLGTKDVQVTAVKGESWLRHLRRAITETSMGKTGEFGPSPSVPGEEPPRWQPDLTPDFATQTLTIHGADLYRLNCQACHGASGGGAPPEINSVINPVRATSVALILERTKKTGQEMSRADAALLASQAKTLLMQRLHKGGEAMPPFSQLNEIEIRSIVAYLEQLTEVPGAERNQLTIKESPYRVGELIVKSTCHVCHGAVGPNPDPQQLLDGTIPPLSTLTTRTSLFEFIRKVTNGSVVILGTPPFSYTDSYRGRMPVFRYLTQDEAADVYLYLTLYPPRE